MTVGESHDTCHLCQARPKGSALLVMREGAEGSTTAPLGVNKTHNQPIVNSGHIDNCEYQI